MDSKRTSSQELLRRFNKAQSELVIQTADLPLGTLADMVEAKAIDLEPSFQRRERWAIEKQSALIESFLLNVPVPPIYLAEESSGKYIAIDGKQRLQSIASFINGRFALSRLERLTAAEGFHYLDLPEEVKNSLRLRPYMRVVTLLKQSEAGLKYEVFLRLNRAGEPLNNQEIRNVAYRGRLNDVIVDLGKTRFLKKQMKINDGKAAAYRKMDDAEFVLRFLTLKSRFSEFSGGLAREMDLFMENHQYDSDQKIDEMKGDFLRAIGWCEGIWGDVAFKRPEGGGWRDQLLAGMYDAQMLAVSQTSDDKLDSAKANHQEVVLSTKQLFRDRFFDEAVRTGTNTPKRIEYRVNKVVELLKGA